VFAKAEYFGFYPLGSDVLYNDVPIMQTTWEACRFLIIVFGKKHVVNPFFGQVFYAEYNKRIVFFTAIEYGLGHYHIFSISNSTQQRLLRKINGV